MSENPTVPGGDWQGYGSSPHGWGNAIDMNVGDCGSECYIGSDGKHKNHGKGYALTNVVKWLEANAETYGFYPYLYSTNLGGGIGKIRDNNGNWVNNYKETWHWNYKPKP